MEKLWQLSASLQRGNPPHSNFNLIVQQDILQKICTFETFYTLVSKARTNDYIWEEEKPKLIQVRDAASLIQVKITHQAACILLPS